MLCLSHVNDHQSFYECGGDSLALMKLGYKVSDYFNVELAPSDLFGELNLGTLKKIIANGGKQKINTDNDFGVSIEATVAQRNLFIQNKLNPKIPFPHSYLTFQVNGNLDLQCLEDALGEVIDTHEGLRTRFQMEKGKVFLKTVIKENCPIIEVSCETDDLNSELHKLSKSFDYSKVPLIRLTFIRLSNNKKYLHFEMPHIISDGESLKIIVQQVIRVYGGYKLSVQKQFRTFLKLAEIYRGSNQYKLDEEFWIMQLKKFDGFQRESIKAKSEDRFRGTHVVLNLKSSLAESVINFSEANKISKYKIFTLSLAILINRVYGESSVAIMSPVSNRFERSMADVVGLLSNVIPLFFNINPDQNIKCWIKDSFLHIDRSLKHQKYPFENIIKAWTSSDNKLDSLMKFFLGYHIHDEKYLLEKTELILHQPVRYYEDMPLSLAITDTGERFILRVSSNRHSLSSDQLNNVAQEYLSILGLITGRDLDLNLKMFDLISSDISLV
ncbi:condensation domain-containing protein [Fulvivirga maritima]|nr:condensation domain-containing protein [Fulvivirga maritima]